MPTAWKQVLTAGHLPHGPTEQLIVEAASQDGNLVFAERYVANSDHQFVMINRATGARTAIQSYAKSDTAAQILSATFDGRYLAYSEMRSTSNFDQWILWLWDSKAGGAPREIGHNAVDAKGIAPGGPYNFPILTDGRVIWAQANVNGTNDVRAYTIATGKVAVVRHGHPGTPQLLNGQIVWGESSAPGALTVLTAISPTTLAPVALPSILTGVRGPAFLASGSGTIVWVDNGLHDLYVWKQGWAQPWHALHTGDDQALQWPHVAGNIVTWDNGTAMFGLDLRTARYVQLTPIAGTTDAWGTSLMVGGAPATKEGHPPLDSTIVNSAALPPLATP